MTDQQSNYSVLGNTPFEILEGGSIKMNCKNSRIEAASIGNVKVTADLERHLTEFIDERIKLVLPEIIKAAQRNNPRKR